MTKKHLLLLSMLKTVIYLK